MADDTIAGADALAVADRLFRAIEAGRVDLVGELYAPDAVIWHNHDGVEQTPDENLRTPEVAGRQPDRSALHRHPSIRHRHRLPPTASCANSRHIDLLTAR